MVTCEAVLGCMLEQPEYPDGTRRRTIRFVVRDNPIGADNQQETESF